MIFDTVIRGGTIVDGTGGRPFAGDLAISQGRIAAIGRIEHEGAEEIDAAGCIVTPGFIDVHTHYDGQAIWSQHMLPSSAHGVTTVVMGNCGVGFAPCRPEDRELLIDTMEGVEDIPEAVMTAGLDWSWESFPEFMEALAVRRRDIDVAMLVPHSPVRVHAMGKRGADRCPADAEDLARMARLVGEATAAGAIGLGSSRILLNRRNDGEHIASYGASEQELLALVDALGDAAPRMFQVVPDVGLSDEALADEIRMLARISAATRAQVTFTFTQKHNAPQQWRSILDLVTRLNREPGVRLRPQIFPRSLGMIIGFDLSANPFSLCPGYIAVAGLPLDERIAELRQPEVRARILAEEPVDPVNPLVGLARAFDYTYHIEEPLNYEPDPANSIAARAARMGIASEALAYDLLLEDDGRSMLYVALNNFAEGSYDFLVEMMLHPDTVIGLGDGGAHYGMICDASYPTFMLSHWVRDRKGKRLPVEQAVRGLSAKPADLLGFADRGLLATGMKADVNVIDLRRLGLCRPEVRYDLPSGGRRLHQRAEGYRAILVAGQAIVRDDHFSGLLPGKVVRRATSIS